MEFLVSPEIDGPDKDSQYVGAARAGRSAQARRMPRQVPSSLRTADSLLILWTL